MRILIYGFGPYKRFGQNVTERIIRCLPSQAGLKKVVFPVRFHRRQFIDALERYRPLRVIGLGQCTRRKIQYETRAINRRRVLKTDPAKPIRQNGPKSLPTTLDIALGRRIGRSDDAGDYVCNYSMYVILDHISCNAGEIKFTFLHIPHDADPRKVAALVARAIKKLQLKARKHP
jgi:pyrrolidone-carboxylate peptidase